jgi:hypothetical protein
MAGNVHGRNDLLEVAGKVKARDLQYLESIVPETLLNLDKALNYRFVIDQVFVNTLEQVHNGLDIKAERDILEKKLTEIATDPISGEPIGINVRMTNLMNKITDPIVWFNKTISDAKAELDTAEAELQAATTNAEINIAKPKVAAAERKHQKLVAEKNEISRQISLLESEKKPIEEELKKLDDFWAIYKSMIKSGVAWSDDLQKRIMNIVNTAKKYKLSSTILWRETVQFGEPLAPATTDLNAAFIVAWAWFVPEYAICDPDSLDKLPSDKPGELKAKTANWEDIILKGIQINTATNQIELQNVTISPSTIVYPANIRLSVRARTQDAITWVNLDCHKSFEITINEPNRELPRRHTTVDVVEWNLSAEYLETRLRQEYENKFNKVQREAFEKVLADNPEFAKLNQAQKDRIYERMQDLGTIANAVKPINLGKDAVGADVTYPVNDITFAPSTHDYSLMPNAEYYNGFKVWLANQAPKDVINDEEKYRQWLRNGLTASLDNGKTHYESFFADVAKQFTDDLNVKTTLNKTLLDFINDTNEADHVWFEADLAATLNATEPLTTNTKKRYQRLAFWTRGEPQNYLSFFSGQSHEFKNESITAGGKTFGYTWKLDIHGAQSVSMSLKMKEWQEQIYIGGNPVALIRTLLNSPDIEPPHARFHAGLSVVKSVTKLARDNGISLRTALTPEMLDTLPIGVRTTLENWENPMVEIEEENGKLVAKVFNLNLTTRRKENEYKMFDEQDFIATQSVRDLRQWVQWLLALTNQTMNNVYSQYREARFRSGLRPWLLRKPRYGGLRNGYKKLSFTGESISVGGKSFNLDCKDGLFTFSGGDLKKPVKGRNIGDLLAYNPALRGVELKAIRVANEKMLAMYQEKLKKQKRHHNYGVIDEENHRVYIYDKNGNLGYYESNDQTFVQRRRQYTSGHRYGRIADENMPTGFRVMKKGDSVVDKESYENFLRNETVVWSMVRAMSRTHRALIAMDPW